MDRKIEVLIENCPQNHKCPAVRICPVGALSQTENNAPVVDLEKMYRMWQMFKFLS